jgi:hypothetical protein
VEQIVCLMRLLQSLRQHLHLLHRKREALLLLPLQRLRLE